ncbi:probable envelope ADP,ATP carrier protein, chloroplastic isoform X2 [Neltuma alba]|uniref:probable envelope ADP,ATP carrier protein, chloroplastic isoform X2 n=1 Tax=Neltuma alba TaxID=207710 RepID=UPI0010A2AEE3|nr:probable envelope ADP,ATP carrier protein, chloroplastic isoform X2 [Prosopis alba]
MSGDRVLFTTRNIPSLANSFNNVVDADDHEPLWKKTTLGLATDGYGGLGSRGDHCKFACVSIAERKVDKEFMPTLAQLLKHPLAVVAFVPRDVSLFFAGAIAGAAAKTITAPLDRIKILMQTHGVRVGQESAKKAIGFIEATTLIAKEEGIKGYWKGNLPQVIRIIPYSAVQLFAYETYKKIFRGKNGELSVFGRLAAGAFAGMTSTFITYPLDVLRLRLAVEPGYRTMTEVALGMLRDEGFASFYYGLGPSLIGIAPYIAVNFCVFDLLKKSLPEKYQKRTETSLLTAVLSASLATITCYPLDTVRRQMQIKGTPYNTVLDALTGGAIVI